MESYWYSISKFLGLNGKILPRRFGKSSFFRRLCPINLYKSLDCFSHGLVARQKDNTCRMPPRPTRKGGWNTKGCQRNTKWQAGGNPTTFAVTNAKSFSQAVADS